MPFYFIQKKALTVFLKRKIATIFILFLFVTITALASSLEYANANTRQLVPVVPDKPFAHFENAPVMLYNRNSATGTMQPLVLLPQTYFAQITGEIGDFFSVVYYDLTGYVRQSAVSFFNYQPVTAFATSTLTATAIGDISAVNLRSLPSSNSSIATVASIGALFTFYGTLPDNSELGAPTSADWFFVRFTNANREHQWAYIYSANAIATPIPPNTVEKVMVYVDPPAPPFSPENFSPPNPLAIILAITLSLAATLIMILIFKKPKTNTEQRRVPRNL